MKATSNKYKSLGINLFVLLLTLFIGASNASAGIEQFTNKIEVCEVIDGAVFSVTDDKYPAMMQNPTTWQNDFKMNGFSDARIVLKYDATNKTLYPTGFNATANVSVTYIKQDLTTSNFSTTLNLVYDPTTGSLSTDQHLYHFKDAHLMTITLTTITTNLSGNEIPAGLILQGEIDVERYYAFDHNFIPTINHSIVDVDGSVDRTLGFEWPVVDGAEEYDLEWTFIDDYNSIGGAKLLNFKNNATRVTVSANNYEIPLVYEKGYVLYRVRGVGKLDPNYIQRVEGEWSSEAFTYTTVNDYPDKYAVLPHEVDNFNWGYQSFFTEEGVRGEGVSYFDGTLKNRQNSSKLNSEDKVVIQETFYDYQGRPAVSALPTPIAERTFKYRNDFNLNTDATPKEYSAEDFDIDAPLPEMSNTNGASNYYSPFNPDKDGANAYIPDAQDYPFTQTLYKNDLTGRVRSQGGLGKDHTIGSGHESKYYYGKPLQYKLTKLFGTDVGFSSSYSETMVIDPNGQASVSVVDASGRIVVINLTGDPPANLEAIPSHTAREQITASILDNTIDATDGYGSFISTMSYISKAGGDHELTYSLDPETYAPCSLDVLCFDCVYDLEISVKDVDNMTEMLPGATPFVVTIGNNSPLNNSCENSTPYNSGTLTVSLPIGSYIITKELKVNQAAIDYYADQYIRESECLDPYQDFFDAFISETDFSGCNIHPCLLSCEGQYGTLAEWLILNPMQDSTVYNALITACIVTCISPKSPCEIYESKMILDLSPGGQYGLFYDFTNNLTDPSIFTLSVFNIGNELPENWDNLTTQTPETGANWTNPKRTSLNPTGNFYYEADGTTLSTVTVVWNSTTSAYEPAVRSGVTPQPPGPTGAEYIYPHELANVTDFLDNWKPSWAFALIEYHPEYCYLGFLCEKNGEENLFNIYKSGIYDQAMLAATTYADALAAGYLNPLNNSVPTLTYIADDPFYTFLYNVYGNGSTTPTYIFKKSLINYSITSPDATNLWDLAFTMVYCPSTTGYTAASINTCINTTHADEYFGIDICKKDEVWRTFRDLYLANKAAFFDLEMMNYSIENGCYNGCIGTTSFDKADFDFDCYEWTAAPDPTCHTSPLKYDANADYNISLNQPCSDNTYANYQDKNKIFTTVYEDYPPSAFPPSGATVTAQFQTEITNFCSSSCDAYADEWIAQLSNCSNISSVQAALKLELVELCMLQCDPLNTTFPTTTAAGSTTVEEVIENHITHANYTTTCHPLLLTQPGPTQPIFDPSSLTILDDCGCDKVLQNEADFAGSGAATSSQLFYDTYGFLPINYQNIVCECNLAAPSWSSGHYWQNSERDYLSITLKMPVLDELACEECLLCTDISSYQTTFDLSANYGFLISDPDYYVYLANYINITYGYNFSDYQIEEFIDNCDQLSSGGNPIWEDTEERLHLELLLHKLSTFGDLFEITPIDLSTYLGTSSLEQHTTGYDYWSDGGNACGSNTLLLHVGTPGVSSETITLDLTNAIPSGYNVDFCNIISLDNLQKVEGATCADLNNFTIDATIIDGLQSVLVTIEGTSSNYPIATCASITTELALCKNTLSNNEEDECTAFLIQTAEDNALQAYLQYLLDEKNQITAALKDKCMSAETTETFDMSYWDQEHHFTLYYYDQSGNLVQTVPPAGVQSFADPAVDIPAADAFRLTPPGTLTPPHTLVTKYRYNSYNQLTQQETPDAGVGNFWYDIAGRLVASQNAQQVAMGDYNYSYTIYDDFGRIIEVGENNTTSIMDKTVAEDPAQLATWYNSGAKTQITRTYYDNTLDASVDVYFNNGQENLRLRVATVAFYEVDGGKLTYDNAIHYSYDITGNVNHAVMENTDLLGLSNSIKHLSYDYDLASGNVNQVIFQEGETDQYFHKYNYDADNRIHEVFTSKNGIIWEKDAKYFYYKHGPLARIELGDEKVQGIDLAYTIQGWLKGVNDNTLDATRDIGKDGVNGFLANVPEVHNSVAKDAFGYTLNYFGGDYAAISQPTALNHFEAAIPGSAYDVSNSDLFNGNIRGMVTAIDGMDIYGNAYKYDQLNRLRTSSVFNNLDVSGNLWPTTGNAMSEYLTDVYYDANGNIDSLNRKGNTTVNMDDLEYYYYADNGSSYRYSLINDRYETSAGAPLPIGVEMTNKLAYVKDYYGFTSQNDYTGGSSSSKFQYDAIGNLIEDPVEEIKQDGIEWTVYGKVKSITRTATSSKSDLEFKYDAMGNRIMKLVKPRTGGVLNNEINWTYYYYQYDAGGNLLEIYEKNFREFQGVFTTTLDLKETNLYGSSRVGIDEINKTLVTQNFTSTGYNSDGTFNGVVITNTTISTDDPNLVARVLGDKSFELSNHLGNVLATVSDKKIMNQTGGVSRTYSSSYETNDGEVFEDNSYLAAQSIGQVRTGNYSIYQTYSVNPIDGRIMHEIKDGDQITATNVYAYYEEEEPGLPANGGQLIRSIVDANGTQLYKDAVGTIAKETAGPTTSNSTWYQLNIGASFTVQSIYYYADNSQVPDCEPIYLLIYTEIPSGAASTWFDDISYSITPITETHYTADIKSRQMYYPFGMVMPNTNNLNGGTYRYGLNGMERDNEVKGAGNSYTSYFRQYDPRLGRWMSDEPKPVAYESGYAAFRNNPLYFTDPSGDYSKVGVFLRKVFGGTIKTQPKFGPGTVKKFKGLGLGTKGFLLQQGSSYLKKKYLELPKIDESKGAWSPFKEPLLDFTGVPAPDGKTIQKDYPVSPTIDVDISHSDLRFEYKPTVAIAQIGLIGNDGTHYNVYYKHYYLGTVVVLPNRGYTSGETQLPQEKIRQKQDEIKESVKKTSNKTLLNLSDSEKLKLRRNFRSLYKGMRITVYESAADTKPWPNLTYNFEDLMKSYFGHFYKSDIYSGPDSGDF